ncbi:MAG: N-formylglutamate amidohydrolase [Nitrospiraceae bacterium]|nr:N-formylglutamate amidohydrolase [Nitrospiraceae bacterium]
MDSCRKFEVLSRADVPKVPVLVHVPHSSTVIPDSVRTGLRLSDRALELELLNMTDWFTDELFDHTLALGGTLFVNRLSRLVVDPERFPDDTQEIMAARGMGAVYAKTSDGRALRQESIGADRQELLSHYFHPYADAIADQVSRILNRHGHCLILDGHSFPSQPLPYELDQTSARPQICLGTDSFHTSPKLVEAIEELCSREGVSTARDRPFSGTYVPLRFWRSDQRVAGLMIEIRRDLYMDETTGKPNDGFLRTHRLISRIIERAVSLVVVK